MSAFDKLHCYLVVFFSLSAVVMMISDLISLVV
jgi:hypothetical protein